MLLPLRYYYIILLYADAYFRHFSLLCFLTLIAADFATLMPLLLRRCLPLY